MLKKLNLSFIIAILGICCFALSGCSKRCDVEEVRAEFAQYPTSSDVAIVYNDTIIYFNDHFVDFNNLIEYRSSKWHISHEYIYFSTGYSNNKKSDYINLLLYKCDLYGNNLQIIYEKNNVKSNWVLKNYNDSIFYFAYSINNTKYVDSYDVSTETLESTIVNKNCKREDYVKNKETKYDYDINHKKDKISIIKKDSSETFVVDNNYLKTTPYYESINKFPYKLEFMRETEDRLFLFYRFVTEGFFEINATYTFAIFEFFYDTKEMSYKYLIQAADIESLIVFIP